MPTKKPPRPPGVGGIRRGFLDALKRSRATLVPPAFVFLWEVTRFLVAYGGRASGKSWSIARVLLILGYEAPLRVLCCREIQGSIKESAYRLLADQIHILGLGDHYEIGADAIIGKNGTRFAFEGLRYNTSRIRSYEGVDVCWIEEAQSVSEMSWETLLPTIRKPGSRLFISFNPYRPDDPVMKRFIDVTPPGCIAHKVSYKDNPYFSPESEAERAWLEQTDPDAYRHVWLGEPRTVSDALILKGKYAVEAFEINPAWAGPYHGLDFGFSRDPNAAIRAYIDDNTRTLYIAKEYWSLGTDIDALPAALETAIPGISMHVVQCDSSRPETVSFLARNGIPNARSAEKWPGSIDDGIAFLRSFARIVIAPECVHFIDEVGSYSFRTDRLTGLPLPEAEDRNNHLIDALRYALSPLIRNLPTGGFFSRPAMLVGGEPLDAPKEGRPEKLFASLCATDRTGTSVGLVAFILSPHHGWPLTICHCALAECDEALADGWLEGQFKRLREIGAEVDALYAPEIWVDVQTAFGAALTEYAIKHQDGQLNVCCYNMYGFNDLPWRLTVEVAQAVKTIVNAGRTVKLSRAVYSQQQMHRGTLTNHFASQVFGFKPEVRDAAAELVHAFSTGILLTIPR